MSLPVLHVGEAVLRQRALEVEPNEITTPAIQNVIAELRATIADTQGVGLAAPQIGIPLRIILVQDLAEYHVSIPPERLRERERRPIDQYILINPELSVVGAETRTFLEACLSVEGLAALVTRGHATAVRYYDDRGERHEDRQIGWHARILQHEVDHLEGRLYVDAMLSRSLMTAGHAKHYAALPVTEIEEAFGV